MNTKYITLLLAIFLCMITTSNAMAQRGKTRKPARATKAVVEIPNADTLIMQYQFEEALNSIQTQIEQSNTDYKLQIKAAQARAGANMLPATANVVFVDSFVVNKSDILSTIKLDNSCGTLDYWKNIFEPNKGVENDVTITTTYINDFKDKLLYCYPDSTGHTKLFCRYLMDSKWGEPNSLGIGDSTSDEAYPYLLADGLTLYYGAISEEGLGGYDIYITRFNTDTKQYLKAENMGMPYNSPYNDYLMAIDEVNNLGWLVSDRYQQQGKVCVYLFIPDESRTLLECDNDDQRRNIAMIHNISATQKGRQEDVAKAKAQLKKLMASSNKTIKQEDFQFAIYNGIKYTSLDEFKSNKAKEAAKNWKELTARRAKVMAELKKNRHEYTDSPSLRSSIIKQEQALEQLDETIKDLEWNIRYEEQIKLGLTK